MSQFTDMIKKLKTSKPKTEVESKEKTKVIHEGRLDEKLKGQIVNKFMQKKGK